jgi:hypothetical protein
MDLDEARERLRKLRPRLDAIVEVRADLAELRADLGAVGRSARGGIAEVKAFEARLYAELEAIAQSGTQVKGYAPLLLDFPGERDNVRVLWCWLEGDDDIDWYHREDCGFAGRRRV